MGLSSITLAVALNCSEQNLCYSSGKLQYGSVGIILEANISGITIINANNAVEDAGCDTDVQWPTIIESVIIYGMREYAVKSNFYPTIDICNIDVYEYFISYYNYSEDESVI